MNLQHIAPGLVKPSHNNNVVARGQTVKALGHQRTDFKPGVGRAFRTLLRRFAAFLDAGTDNANRTKLCAASTLPACSPPLPSSLLGLHRESLLSDSLSSSPREAARPSSRKREESATASTWTIFPELYSKAEYPGPRQRPQRISQRAIEPRQTLE